MHSGGMFYRHFDAFKLNCGPCKISGPKRHLKFEYNGGGGKDDRYDSGGPREKLQTNAPVSASDGGETD